MFSKNKNGCFDCDNCPKNNDQSKDRYCVMWLEGVETNLETKEERITKNCGYVLMPKFLAHTMSAASRPAAALEGLRNEMARGFERLPELILLPPPRDVVEKNGKYVVEDD